MGNPARAPRKAAAGPFHASVSTVATAQILRASGYSAAEPAALSALSDITGRYITSLGRAASALAEARGRTEPNVADIVLALEDHAQGGFPGASDPACPVLRSGAIAELAGFVAAVQEVPFAKPLPRREEASGRNRWESFAAAGEEPPLRHVPRWLPRFPAGWKDAAEAKYEEEDMPRWPPRFPAGWKDAAEAKCEEEEDTGEVVTAMPANGYSGMARGRGTVPGEEDMPRWLPRFPAGWKDAAEAKCEEEEDTGEVVTALPANDYSGMARGRGTVPEKREKVSFRITPQMRRRVGPVSDAMLVASNSPRKN